MQSVLSSLFSPFAALLPARPQQSIRYLPFEDIFSSAEHSRNNPVHTSLAVSFLSTLQVTVCYSFQPATSHACSNKARHHLSSRWPYAENQSYLHLTTTLLCATLMEFSSQWRTTDNVHRVIVSPLNQTSDDYMMSSRVGSRITTGFELATKWS